MIASLRGDIVMLTSSGCVIDVGGVGYAVSLTPTHARSLTVGESASFATTLIVREDSTQLFGFASGAEQGIFEALLGVSGIGPRSALAVLSRMSPREIFAAVVAEDDGPFRKVSGIGPKTAKLVVVSLAGRLSHLVDGDVVPAHDDPGSPTALQSPPGATAQVIAALVGLGWNEKVASDAVSRLGGDAASMDAAAMLRAALTELGAPGPRS